MSRRVLLFLLFLLCTISAQERINMPQARASMVERSHPVDRDYIRQGGDTIESATPISELPFNAVGTTAGFANDYEESCPFFGNSPDVVYVFTPEVNMMIDVDLCGSSYDTKTYIYDQNIGLVACNDDYFFDDDCGWYVSKIVGAVLFGGAEYYIVVDGYSGDFGDYVLEVSSQGFCDVECPPGSAMENEPPLIDGYVDTFNSGCDGSPMVFQRVSSIIGNRVTICGRNGWYEFDGVMQPDADWYEILTTEEQISWTVITEFGIRLRYGRSNCSYVILSEDIGVCEVTVTEAPTHEGYTVYRLKVRAIGVPPAETTEFDYVLEISGILDWGVPAESVTWSTVKALYR